MPNILRQVKKVYALYYQYRVLPGRSSKLKGKISGAMATVIVFADSDQVGRSRCGRFIAKHDWVIEEFIRVMVLGKPQIEHLDFELSKLYKKAEQFGIAACFDTWTVPQKRTGRPS